MSDLSHFPARLAELRQRAGLSLAALSVLSGVSVTQISVLERGQGVPTLETALRLAGALGVGVEGLLEPPSGPVERAGAGRPRKEK